MEVLEIENATFYPDKIVIIKNKGNIEIDFADIQTLRYTKPTFSNYFFALVSDLIIGCPYPKTLEIYYINKVGKMRTQMLKMEHEDFLKLPDTYKNMCKVT